MLLSVDVLVLLLFSFSLLSYACVSVMCMLVVCGRFWLLIAYCFLLSACFNATVLNVCCFLLVVGVYWLLRCLIVVLIDGDAAVVSAFGAHAARVAILIAAAVDVAAVSNHSHCHYYHHHREA